MGDGGSDRATVLVVEDEADNRELFREVLAREYVVRTAADGEEALAELDDVIDVVLLDRRIPGISGDRVLEEIDAEGLDCRVAMVSAVDPDFDVIDMGFDDYLVKPVRPQSIRETVDRLLTLSEYEIVYQELSAKRVKKNILEVEKMPSELEQSEEFQRLEREIETLEARLDEMETDLDERILPS